MNAQPLRTLRSAQNPCEAGPGGDLREFEIEYHEFGVRRKTMFAQSAHLLRSELERSHPEWFPVAIVEVKHD